MLLGSLSGDGVAVSLGGHGHVESGIEDSDLGSGGHDLLASLDAHQVGGVVQGSQGDALLDGSDDLIVDDAGIEELHAAVQDAVTDSVDLLDGLDDTVNGVNQDAQGSGNGLGC